ncbi:signal recognition particle-docking protein FtsY [Candidatus Pacearchaeota archaeon]|nr:signal recognition particle-docking protein FtsY [Candidatus Pacearchaeota archaeon]
MFNLFKEKLKNLIGIGKKEPEIEEKKKEKKSEVKKIVKEIKKSAESKKKSIEKEIVKEELHEKIEDLEEKIEEKEIQKTEAKEEKIKEESIETEEPEEKQGFFSRLIKLPTKLNTVRLDQETFNEFFEKLEAILLENNVALSVVDKIREDMEKRLVNIEIKKDRLEQEIKNTLKESILEILIPPFDLIEIVKKKEGAFVIVFFGINGSGKTTTIAKLASLLQKNKISCVFAAADTFRAASIEQLEKHGNNLNIKVIKQNYGADPAAVAFDAIQYANAHSIKAVLIDTAGRMHTKSDLLKEMEKIIRVAKPDLKVFVAESITGNDAVEQAKNFNDSAGIDGVILTKADVDEKGGTAISIGHVTNKPILFLGTGQNYNDLQKFDPNEVIVNLGLD